MAPVAPNAVVVAAGITSHEPLYTDFSPQVTFRREINPTTVLSHLRRRNVRLRRGIVNVLLLLLPVCANDLFKAMVCVSLPQRAAVLVSNPNVTCFSTPHNAMLAIACVVVAGAIAIAHACALTV